MSAQSSLFRRIRTSRSASARTISYRRSLCAQTILASAHYAERFTANPERPARTPHALQEAEIRSWLPIGEAYSALRDWRPISGRSSLPFRLALFRKRRSFQLLTAAGYFPTRVPLVQILLGWCSPD